MTSAREADVPVTINLSSKIYENITRMAKANNVRPAQYVDLLFLAAYAARCGKSDDATLHKVVKAFVGFDDGKGS